jgi:hypothetical protein
MSDNTNHVKSGAKIYMYDLLAQYKDDAKSGHLPGQTRSGFRIALEAGANAINGGGGNPEALQTAVTAATCAIAVDKLGQKDEIESIVSGVITKILPDLVEKHTLKICPLRRDRRGNLIAPDGSTGPSLTFGLGRMVSMSIRNKGIAVFALVLITGVFVYGFGLWVKMNAKAGTVAGSAVVAEKVVSKVGRVSK